MNQRGGPIAKTWAMPVSPTSLVGNSDTVSRPAAPITVSTGLELKAGALSCTIEEQPSLLRVLDADASLTASTSDQAWFPSSGSVTLESAKAYMFRGTIFFNANNVAVTTRFAGTATTSSIAFRSIGQRIASGSSSATQTSGWQNGTTLPTTGYTAANATTGNGWITVEGIVRVTTAGTFTPQIAFGAGISSPTVYRNSWFALWELGANTFTSRGSWS